MLKAYAIMPVGKERYRVSIGYAKTLRGHDSEGFSIPFLENIYNIGYNRNTITEM